MVDGKWKNLRPDVFDVKLAVARILESDDRYELENAAKFRAVGQNVASYDEFKAIVDGCHLKPLDRKEDLDAILKPNEHSWNTATNSLAKLTVTQEPKITGNKNDPNNLNARLVVNQISIYGDFERLWRKVKNDPVRSRELLLGLEETTVFKENCEPLDEIIIRLNQFSDDEIKIYGDKVSAIIKAVSSSKRFSVSVAFMDNGALSKAKELIERLKSANHIKIPTYNNLFSLFA